MIKPRLPELASTASSLPADRRGVRLRRDGDRWSVIAETREGRKHLGFVEAAAVDALRQKAHLVERPDGMLEPLSQREQRSGRLTAQRPVRPVDKPAFNDAESPLTWLRTRKDKLGRPLISEDQFLARERLRADFERAMLARRITSNWDMSAPASGRGGSGTAELSDGTLAARQRFHAAMDAVGPELSSILLQVCCLAAGLEQAERLLDLPQRSGKAVLGLALNALSRHYGMGQAKPATARKTFWAVPNYRPAISEPEDA